MKRHIFFLMVAFTCWEVRAQQLPDPANFDNRTHDFGEIKEVDGPVMHEFLFTNELDVPVRIVNVKASCGCTTPGWSKDEILPGESGYVQAQYNPRNRPGVFRKSLRVTTDAQENNITTFYITGTVIGKPRTPQDDFPVLMGDIRFKSRTFNLGRVTTNGKVSRQFEVYNEGDAPVSFDPEQTQAPDHIKVEFPSEPIQPKSSGTVQMVFDPVAKSDLGYVNDRITLHTDEDSAAAKELFVVASITEYFGPLTPERLAESPKLQIATPSHDFGRVNTGTTVSQEFILTNQGAGNLNIRTAKTNCSCVTYTLDKYDLAPQETAVMTLIFDTTGRRGNQQKAVTIFSNDPSRSAQVITVKASVSEPSSP